MAMSLDRSLKTGGKLSSKRSVMKRTERIAKMIADRKFDPAKDRAIGIPKTLAPKA
jgi:small basic protein (TIGR04137 family)